VAHVKPRHSRAHNVRLQCADAAAQAHDSPGRICAPLASRTGPSAGRSQTQGRPRTHVPPNLIAILQRGPAAAGPDEWRGEKPRVAARSARLCRSAACVTGICRCFESRAPSGAVPAGGTALVHDDVRVECAGAAVFSVTFARSPDVPASGTVSHSSTRIWTNPSARMCAPRTCHSRCAGRQVGTGARRPGPGPGPLSAVPAKTVHVMNCPVSPPYRNVTRSCPGRHPALCLQLL
jgi:hypothetical protein